MAKPYPAATVAFAPAGAGLLVPPSRVHAVIGCCTDGLLLDPFPFQDADTLTDERGAGPAVKGGAYSLAGSGAPIIFQRVPATARAAYRSPLDLSEVTGTASPTAAGTPTDGYDVVIRVTIGGTIGTNTISYVVSTDGGESFGTTQTMAIAGPYTIVIGGTTLTFTTATTLVTNDIIRFYTLPASASILTQTLTRAAADVASTSTATLTGTPVDAYEVYVEIVTGGEVGVKGISYRYSLDGGRTFSNTLALGTAEDFDLLDGEEYSGLNLAFDAGETLNAGDVFQANTTAPEASAADIVSAIEALDESNHQWSFLHIVGEQRPADASTIGAALQALATSTNGDERYTLAILSARDRTQGEDDLAWSQRLVDDFASLDNERLSIGAGMARMTCPITGRRNRRPAAWVVARRVVEAAIEEDPGKMALGSLSSDVAIYNEQNQVAEHDSLNNSVLYDNGFVVLRTRPQRGGVYITEGSMFTDSSIGRIPQRRVLDLCALVARQTAEEFLQGDYYANPDGTLSEADAADLDLEIDTAIRATLGPAIGGVTVRTNRTSQVLLTGELGIDVTVAGKVYVRNARIKIKYQRPDLAALQTQAQ